MLKRTFILFFCIGQILAIALFSEQAVASCRSNAINSYYEESEDGSIENDEFTYPYQTFLQADEFEWKENLSELLRHRTSNYRFICFESMPSAYLHFSTKSVVQHYKRQIIGSVQRLSTLPDYYSFLHRLCPF